MTFLMLLIFSYNVIFLFVGTASLGLFLSSTFPSMLAYTEDILQYKGKWQRKHRSSLASCGWWTPHLLAPACYSIPGLGFSLYQENQPPSWYGWGQPCLVMDVLLSMA